LEFVIFVDAMSAHQESILNWALFFTKLNI